jgi:hypothetical protein
LRRNQPHKLAPALAATAANGGRAFYRMLSKPNEMQRWFEEHKQRKARTDAAFARATEGNGYYALGDSG